MKRTQQHLRITLAGVLILKVRQWPVADRQSLFWGYRVIHKLLDMFDTDRKANHRMLLHVHVFAYSVFTRRINVYFVKATQILARYRNTENRLNLCKSWEMFCIFRDPEFSPLPLDRTYCTDSPRRWWLLQLLTNYTSPKKPRLTSIFQRQLLHQTFLCTFMHGFCLI